MSVVQLEGLVDHEVFGLASCPPRIGHWDCFYRRTFELNMGKVMVLSALEIKMILDFLMTWNMLTVLDFVMTRNRLVILNQMMMIGYGAINMYSTH